MIGLTALLYALAPVPSAAAPVTDAQLYKDAMECKVLVEALQPMARPDKLKIVRAAVAFWAEKEQAAGEKLGKKPNDLLVDEMLFGVAVSGNALDRAGLCMQAAVTARR
jgi:hypothetical protein